MINKLISWIKNTALDVPLETTGTIIFIVVIVFFNFYQP